MIRIREIYFFLAFVFLHFVWFRPLGFPLTLAPITIIYIFYLVFDWDSMLDSPNFWIAVLIVGGLPLLPAFQIGFDGASGVQFFRTYALWLTAALTIALAWMAPLKGSIDFARPAILALVCITLCVGTQAITSQSGNIEFFNLFGSHQYFGEIELETLSIEDRLRPPGFYLEPSFCAYVITNLTAICIIQDKYRKLGVAVGAIGILFIQSLTGLLAFGAMLIFYAINRRSKNSGQGNGRLSAVLILAIPFVALLWYYYFEYISVRMSQIYEVGSSTYYRVIGPMPILLDVLMDHPFGYALGRVREVVPKYMIPHGVGFGESIDNGIYLLIFYFGWLGLIFAIWTAVKIFSYAKMGYGNIALCILVAMLGAFFNGGIMLPEYALLTMCLIIAARVRPYTT